MIGGHNGVLTSWSKPRKRKGASNTAGEMVARVGSIKMMCPDSQKDGILAL